MIINIIIIIIIYVFFIVTPAFQHPLQTYGYAFLFSMSGYLGVNVVLSLLKYSGALITVTGRFLYTFLFITTISCKLLVVLSN